MVGLRTRIGMAIVVALLVVLSGVSLGRVYNGPLLAVLVSGAALGAVLVSTLLRRAASWLVAPVSVMAVAGYALAAMSVSARAGGVDGDLTTLAVDAARNAVPRLLTALIPVEAQPDTVLAPVVLAWLAGFAGAEFAMRSGHASAALVPPTLLYAGALVLVGPNAAVLWWQPVLFATIAALGLAGSGAGSRGGVVSGLGSHERRSLRQHTASGLGASLLILLVFIAFIAPWVATAVSRGPSDPRRYVSPPSLDVLDQNPLIRISGWAANPSQRLFEVTVLRGAPRTIPRDASIPDGGIGAYDTRLRLAVLSNWDGVTWHLDADYRNAGRVLPTGAIPGPATGDEVAPPVRIEERITVGELQGRLLPAVSAPRRVDGVRVAFDASSGTLLHPERLVPGIAYTVTSLNPSADVNLLPAADVPSGPDVARYLEVGDTVPPDLSRLAELVAAGEGSPYLRALALEVFLAEHYRFAADAPSGHSYPNLRFFLFADPRAGGQRGTSEQFAASFAALGRLLGLPTRVVVGFQTPAGGGPVTGADAQAWPEVLFDGVGWVAFDPMPRSDTPPRPLEDEFLPKPLPPTSAPASPEPEEEATRSAAPPSQAAAVARPGGRGIGPVAGRAGGGLLVLLALLTLAVIALRAWHRRRRLDLGSAPQRILGAWAEVLDALALAGAAPPSHLAAAEVADHAAAVAQAAPGWRHVRRPRPAVPRLDDLAARVNDIGFAPEAFRAEQDTDAAARAKDEALGYARALRARRPWWRRLLWSIDPRPLRRRR